jgi:hypothetical protein
MRRAVLAWAVVLMCAVVLAAPRPALAHGDGRLVAETLQLRPGGSVEFGAELHYHRLVGRFSADGPIVVTLVERDTGSVAVELGPDSDLTVNRLVRCCDGRAWTPYVLVIGNRGDTAVTVAARATLVHDDLAVMVYRAESGTVESVVVMGGLWTWVLWRIRRRRLATTASRAAATLGVLLGSVLGLASYGALRYGAGSAPALLAGLADVPVLPFNPLVSRASLLVGAAMIGWAVAGARWAKARTAMSRWGWMALGAVVVGAVVISAGAIATAYEVTGMPLAMALTATVPVLVFMAIELRGRHAGS